MYKEVDNFVSRERDFNQVTKYKCNFEAERLWENYFGRRIVGVERGGVVRAFRLVYKTRTEN